MVHVDHANGNDHVHVDDDHGDYHDDNGVATCMKWQQSVFNKMGGKLSAGGCQLYGNLPERTQLQAI